MAKTTKSAPKIKLFDKLSTIPKEKTEPVNEIVEVTSNDKSDAPMKKGIRALLSNNDSVQSRVEERYKPSKTNAVNVPLPAELKHKLDVYVAKNQIKQKDLIRMLLEDLLKDE